MEFRDLQDAEREVATSRFALARTIGTLNLAIAELDSLIHEF
jgi:hypothetical protein